MVAACAKSIFIMHKAMKAKCCNTLCAFVLADRGPQVDTVCRTMLPMLFRMTRIATSVKETTTTFFHPNAMAHKDTVHYAKSYRPFELFVNENYKL